MQTVKKAFMNPTIGHVELGDWRGWHIFQELVEGIALLKYTRIMPLFVFQYE